MAIISKSNKFCFIHIPRTGGDTVKKLLIDIDKNTEQTSVVHSTIKDVLNIYPEVKNYYKFSYVRHPYDWVVSLFSSINLNKSHPDYNTVKSINLTEFIEWIIDVGRKRGVHDGLPLYIKQSDYVFINKKLSVDYIYRFEDICDDISTSNINSLFLQLGFDMPKHIPVINKSERGISWEYLFNKKAYDLMNKIFLDDFINFKYPRKHVR